MAPHLVFFHQRFPGQFGPVMSFLQQQHGAQISFFSEFVAKPPPPGIQHYFYKPHPAEGREAAYFFSRYFEQEAQNMFGVYQAVEAARLDTPDRFIGHVGFGNLMFLHVAYPEIPAIGFFEIYYALQPLRHEVRPGCEMPHPNTLRIPLRNATQLLELEYCTKGYSPTPFQRSTFPDVYQHKLTTLFDGVDSDFYRPGPVDGESDLKRTWPADARLVTYVSRGLEWYRGFDVFLEMALQLAQQHDDVHFVIAGNDKAHYGPDPIFLKDKTLKAHLLRQERFQPLLPRLHFLDWISEPALRDLFRLSDCHFYWTVPHALSWSLFQAMSSGCLVLASDTTPVRDLVQHNENGILCDPDDVPAMTAIVSEVLAAPDPFKPLREAARQTIADQYDFKICLPKLADFYLAAT